MESYASKLAQEAEIWSTIAEQQASTVLPDWHYHRNLRHNAIVHTNEIDKLLGHVCPGFNVLELGCSSGWLTVAMARRGAHASGVDIGEKSLEIARSYYESIKESVSGSATYQVADLNRINLPIEQYDLVVAKGILHHLLNPANLINQICRALKPGGLLWISDTNGKERLPTVLIASILTFVLPTQVSYREKIIGLLHFGIHAPERIKASMQAEGVSPFEGVGRQQDWLHVIRDHFDIEQHIEHPAFTGYVTAQAEIPDWLAFPILRTMYRLDCALVRSKILRGTGITLYARKPLHSS